MTEKERERVRGDTVLMIEQELENKSLTIADFK
jgi:hypothetical protein